MGVEILVPLTFFLFLGAVIIVPMYLAHKGRMAKMDLLRQAIDKGQPIDAKVLEQLYEVGQSRSPRDQARKTLGSGVILTALSVGLGIAAYYSGDFAGGDLDGMGIAAAIVGCLGIAFIFLALFDYATKKKDEPPAQS
jgi:hypothetical protein